MSKVMKFINSRSKSRGKLRQERRESAEPLTSPRSVAFESHSVEELFRKAAFDEEPVIPFEQSNGDLELTDEPSETDYDFNHDTFYSEYQSSPTYYARSRSVTRPLQDEDHRLSRSPTRRRAKSTGRSERRSQTSPSSYMNPEHTQQPKKRKSKMEKIVQLQEKNQRYKDEFRKVQKDRKALKKELENKKLETAALTKEIDTHITETSILKLKLSEALQQLDKTDQYERRDKSSISKLQRELTQVKGEYDSAVSRIARWRDEMEKYKVSVHRRDEQIKHLSQQINEQSKEIDDLNMELMDTKRQSGYPEEVDELKKEKQKLEIELSATLDRASNMVKEREDAIAELLRENEELRAIKSSESSQPSEIDEDEVHAVRAELDTTAQNLEEAQDRNVLLEEELESWERKGENLQGEIRKLRDDAEAWQQKAAAAEDAMHICEASAQESARKAVYFEIALKEAEERHAQQLQEQEHKHTEALLDLKEKTSQKLTEAEKAAATPNPQEIMLQKAVAARREKQAKGGWGSVLNRVVNNDGDAELSEEQKRIKELEATNADQEEDIRKLKSDMVKLKSTYNDTMYTNKKRIEQLEHENREYAAKQKGLEIEIKALRRGQANFPDILDGRSTRSR